MGWGKWQVYFGNKLPVARFTDTGAGDLVVPSVEIEGPVCNNSIDGTHACRLTFSDMKNLRGGKACFLSIGGGDDSFATAP